MVKQAYYVAFSHVSAFTHHYVFLIGLVQHLEPHLSVHPDRVVRLLDRERHLLVAISHYPFLLCQQENNFFQAMTLEKNNFFVRHKKSVFLHQEKQE